MKVAIGKSDPDKENSWLLEMPKMRQLLNEGKNKEALEIYDRLPQKIKSMKAVQITHILITSGLDDDEKYEAAINEYTTLYPNEPNMHLLLLDGYFIKKEYDKALHSVNEMDKMIDKDPFLDYYRYLIYKTMEDTVHAKTSIETLMKNMPGLKMECWRSSLFPLMKRIQAKLING
jgi:tetratricopeptide (TPR) repeat protein